MSSNSSYTFSKLCIYQSSKQEDMSSWLIHFLNCSSMFI